MALAVPVLHFVHSVVAYKLLQVAWRPVALLAVWLALVAACTAHA